MTNGHALTDRIQVALTERRLWGGCLLRAPSKPDVSNSAEESWYFSTGLTPALLSRFQKEASCAVITSDLVDISPDHSAWVIAYQVDEIQHRFLVPLVGQAVGGVIADSAFERLHLLMQAGPVATALKVPFYGLPSLALALASRYDPVANAMAVLEDVVIAAASLLVSTAISSILYQNKATEVSVTVVLPPELLGTQVRMKTAGPASSDAHAGLAD